jgi:hypothetical protein
MRKQELFTAIDDAIRASAHLISAEDDTETACRSLEILMRSFEIRMNIRQGINDDNELEKVFEAINTDQN